MSYVQYLTTVINYHHQQQQQQQNAVSTALQWLFKTRFEKATVTHYSFKIIRHQNAVGLFQSREYTALYKSDQLIP